MASKIEARPHKASSISLHRRTASNANTSPWHTKAVGERSPCTLGRRLVATGFKLGQAGPLVGNNQRPLRAPSNRDGTCALTSWPRCRLSRKSRLRAPVQQRRGGSYHPGGQG